MFRTRIESESSQNEPFLSLFQPIPGQNPRPKRQQTLPQRLQTEHRRHSLDPPMELLQGEVAILRFSAVLAPKRITLALSGLPCSHPRAPGHTEASHVTRQGT